MENSETPAATYREIIDKLVNDARQSVAAKLVRTEGIFSRAPSRRTLNKFVGLLSHQQRNLLSQMLEAERDSAFHDVLAELTWWISCRDVGWTVRGEPMPVDQSGMGLHGDYVGRRDGWEWPIDQ
jgi:hypothetical protein